MTTALSLYSIEDTLRALAIERRAAEFEGDSEAVAAIDQAHADYLAQRGEKIDSYCALIHEDETIEEAAQREIDRWTSIRDAARNRQKRLKEIAMGVMNQFGVRELRNHKSGQGMRV